MYDTSESGSNFDIVDRQIDYYFNVLKWLKVCKKEEEECLVLTQKGQNVVSLPFRRRIEALAEIVFSDPISNAVLHRRAINPNYFYVYNVHSESTINRRLRTIRSWVKYFKNILEEE